MFIDLSGYQETINKPSGWAVTGFRENKKGEKIFSINSTTGQLRGWFGDKPNEDTKYRRRLNGKNSTNY